MANRGSRITLTITLAALVLSGCASEGSGQTRTQPTAAAGFPSGGRALSYQFGGVGDRDRDIANAQAEVRSAPGQAGPYARLARAFLVRYRAVGDRALLELSRDAADAGLAIERTAALQLIDTAVLLAERDFRGAVTAAKALIALGTGDSTPHLLLGDAKLELGDYDGAVAAYDKAMGILPDLRAFSRAGYVRWLHGDIEGALEMYNAALGAAGRDREPAAFVYVDVARLFAHAGDTVRTVAAANRALELVPDYPPALSVRGHAHATAKNTAAAIRDLEAAIAARPSATDKLLLADQHRAAGDTAAADRIERDALKDDSEPTAVSLYLARHRVDPARALELARLGYQRSPDVDAAAAIALAQLRSGHVAEARKSIDTALARGTPNADFYLIRGLVQAAQNQRDAARADLSRARTINRRADAVLVAELSAAVEIEGSQR